MVNAASLVRRTAIVVLFLAALAILLIAPGAVSAEGTGSTESPVWSADMLVVEYTSIAIGAASADLFSNIGGSADLQIKSLWSYIPDRDIRLSFEDGVPDAADYTLQVGDLTLEFPEESSGNSSFKWTDVDVDWEDGRTISVRIVQTSALEEPAANTPATGEPAISGTAQVDQTLTANTSAIADEDGLDDVSYSYQWIRSDNGADTDISGETDSTYTLVYADQGKTVKVKVSFTDDASNDETLTSEATEVVTAAPNRGATGDPTINGTPKVDQTLMADTSDIADEDGLTRVSYSYRWTANDVNIDGATGSTYVLANGDAGKAIRVSVSFTDDRNNAETRTSVATTAVLATVPTQPLSLTVATGDEIQELDASWQAPSSNGGSAVTGYKLQWKGAANRWDTEADVSQTTVTGTTHTITGLTGGQEYAVRVIATNTAGDGPASAEAAGTPSGATSQQNTGDSTSPTVSSIAITSDPGSDEVYAIGEAIQITVAFSADVTVTGKPQLELDIGGNAKPAEYQSTNASSTVFGYTVAEEDSDTDGIAVTENKLTLNGGSIKDADDSAANLAHSALPAQTGHKVDGVRPTISSINLGGSKTPNLFILDEVMGVSVLFTEEIFLDGSPYITLDVDSGPQVASFERIRLPCPDLDASTSTATLAPSVPEGEDPPPGVIHCFRSDTHGISMSFNYTVAKGDLDADGLGIAANALSLNGGTLRDAAGNDAVITHEAIEDSAAHVIDGVPPEITSIEIISDPGEDDTYAAGDTITLNITFSERLEIDFGSPRLRLDIGGKTRMAYRVRRNVLDIQAGETGYIMAYSYTVQDGDNDEDGISIPANPVHRLWAYVKDINGNDAIFEHEAIADDAEHKVATTTADDDTDNTQKTGLLTISGTLQVGETVSADFSNLTDDDGVDYAASTAYYSWSREGGGLSFLARGNPSYVIASADEGNKLRVNVEFFDDNGNKEYLRSPWTEPVGPRAPSNSSPTGLPTITGTPQVDQTLTANTSSISDSDGLTSVSYSYQWIAGGTDIDAATGSSYTLTSSELGKTIQVGVSFADDRDNAESLTSAATAAVTRPPPSRAPEMDGISIHDGMLRVSGGDLELVDVNADRGVAPADVGSYISSFKVQWKSGSQGYDATRQAVLAPKPMTATNVTYYFAHMPSYDITGLTNGVEYTVRVIATNAGGDGPPSQEQTATPGTKSEELWQYIEDEIVEEHEASHPWLRQTLNYLRNNNIPLMVWTDASDPNTVETYSDDSSELDPGYVESLNFPVSIVDGPEATKKETILINLAYIYTMTNGVSSSPAPLGIAHVYFSESFLNLVSTNGACWESRLYLDVVVSLVLNDSLAGASDWNRCMARSEDATALAVVRSALSGQTPAWFADTYNDSEGNPDLDRLWSGVQIIGGGHERVVAYQLRNSFGGYCDSGPDWGLKISRSLSRALASAGFDTLVNPWRDGGCVPSAPISLTANLEGDGAASVSWEAPESNGGSLLSGYRIQWQSVDAEEGTTPQTKHVYFDDYSDEARPTEVSETIEGLTDGVEYTVRVLAHNPNGDGTAAEVTVPEPNAAPTGVPEISGTPQVDQTLHVAAPDPEAYVTVVITSSDDTVSWSDPDECASDYNTYLKVTSGPGTGTKSRTHIGSVASGSTEATQTISYTWTGNFLTPPSVEVELYCGTFDDSSDENDLIASTGIAMWRSSLKEGTFSSAPLTALSISSGTLSPAFDRGIGRYTAEVANDVEVITLDPTVLTGYQTDFVRNPGWGVVAVCGRGCSYGYGNGATTGIVLADADDETEGFQIDLNRGENRLGLGVNKGNVRAGPGRLYYLTVTVENSPATGQPTINGTAQVGQTLTVDTSGISDADGLDNVTYSYQWLSSRDTEIDGATSSTYTFQSSDNGKLIKVRVTFTDDAGYDESLTSEATVAVAATVPSDPQSLTVTSGSQIQELDVSWQAPSSNGGSAVTGYKVQWKESTDSWDTADDVSEATETGTTHTITVLTGGVEYAVRVIASNDVGDGPASTEVKGTPAGGVSEQTVEPENSAPTGLPSISGTPQVDQTLTASTSNIDDEDGLTNVSYRYQWSAGGSDIEGATGSTYTLTYSEQGQTIQVQVSFTDDANNEETLTSVATVAVAAAPNREATGAPTVGGTPQVDQTLTSDTSAIDDADGLTNVSYGYQWIAGGSDIEGATGSSYLLTSSEQGQIIQVRVSFTDDRDNAETLTSEATVEVTAVPVPLTASFLAAPSSHDGDNSFTFELRLSEEVDLSYVTLRDHDAFSVTDGEVTGVSRLDKPGNLRWQIVVEPDSDADVTIVLPPTTDCGALGAICTGGGKKLSGRVELTVNGPEQQNQEQQNNSATGAPAISGTPQVGETLTASTSDIDDEDGLTNVSYRYQWIAGGSDIYGATGSSHLLTASQQGQTVQVKVTFTDDADNQESLTSAETLAVAARPNTAATGEPTISGTPQVDETLTADTSTISDEDGLANVSYQYQWLRDDADIAGQTNSTYRLVSADEGKTIRVRVTFRDDADNAESLTSAATTAVAAQPTPAVLLTASFANVPADHNGGNFTFQLTFSENVDAGYARIRDHALTVTGGSIASASRITQGSNQGWNVEVDPTGNGSVTITLPETTDCDASGAICTDDSRKLSHSTSATVAGPSAISVSDAAAQEAEEAVLVFTITLSHASSRTVTVGYATSDGTAQAGSDYTAASATLTFNAGEISQTVQVTVLTDSEDESEETLTLTLSNPSQATLDDATGAGAIENGESSSGTQEDPPVVLLTGSFSNMPATHNGSAFTFDLSFSENVKAGYARIRDHAFTISGTSTIANAVRKTQGSNQNWTITVQPGGNDAITITLPSTTNCSSQRGICTYDDRMLSNELRLTVTGPDAANSRDTTAPTISSVAMTSDPDENDADLGAYIVGRSGGSIVQSTNWASGVYRIGDDVQVTVTFSENVTVTGSPQLELAIGSNSRTAGYESADGSAVVFSYTVAVGDSDSDGIAVAANKLTLNGGSVKDAANNDADLSHNALTAQAGHEVDGVRPRLKLTVSDRLKFGASSGGTDGAYTTGEELIIRVAFTEGGVRGSVTGPPRVALNFDGGGPRVAKWDPSLIFNPTQYPLVRFFSYVVQEGDLDSDGPTIGANAIDLAGGFIRDAAGNDAVLTHSAVAASSSFIVDAVAPTVSSIAITSDPGSDDTYGTGDKIEVTVTFSENMSIPTSITCSSDVVHCKAELELDIGGTARTADYQSHTGADVVYAYTVQAGDTDDNGIAIGDNKLTGQRIMDATGKFGYAINDADLSHDALADNAGHKVSGTS